MRIGSHVSTRRGYREAAKAAAAMGGNAFQYFPKNPRSLQLKAFDRRDAESCADWCEENRIVSIAHGPYGVNPATEGETARLMAACTLNDLEIAEACGSLGVVVHFGVFKGADPLHGYRNVIQWINTVTSAWPGKSKVLLENLAGDHGRFGTTPEELAQIRALCREPEKVGFCLDTCHLYASGEGAPDRWTTFVDRASKCGFFDGLEAIHLNDSRFPFGSRKDRHAPIGEGCIGLDGFKAMLTSAEMRGIPLFLETPADPDGSHKDQIELVRRLEKEAGAE